MNQLNPAAFTEVEGAIRAATGAILRDQKPERFSFKGSGFPIPTKGSRRASLIKVLIRLRVFLSSLYQ